MKGGTNFIKFGTTMPFCQSLMPFSFILVMESFNESIVYVRPWRISYLLLVVSFRY